tara:strand:- start:922 stop:1608 length:687 start_codon:yes stop_codon:yes gene_type:complete
MKSSNLQNKDLNFSQFIHQAALNPHLSKENLIEICDASKHFQFSGLCTDLIKLSDARKQLGKSTHTKLIAVIAFPFGSIPSAFKKHQAEYAISQGADELEVVPNYFALTQGNTNLFAEELAELCELEVPVRAILDISNLTANKLSQTIEASIEAGVCGLQSGNGFGTAISNRQIKQLSQLIKGRCALKAVGGIRDFNLSMELIDAGADHLGTSYGLELIQELRKFNQK